MSNQISTGHHRNHETQTQPSMKTAGTSRTDAPAVQASPVERTAESGLMELLAASPKFHAMLQDLKQLEKYMTEDEKRRVVQLVQKAMKA